MTEFKPADINAAPICIKKNKTSNIQILEKSNTEEELWP